MCCGVETWASLFTLHRSGSLSCIYEYLVIDSGVYLCKNSFQVYEVEMEDNRSDLPGIKV